jgi:hypothetical protein
MDAMAKTDGVAQAKTTPAPEPRDVADQWQRASAQWAERSTDWARQCVGAGLHWMIQSADGTRQWAQTLDGTARHWSDMARSAEHKLRTIDDLAALWNLELDLAGHGAETGTDWGQHVWADQMRALSALAQDGALQGSRLMQAWADAGQTQEAQTFWSTATAQTAAMQSAPQHEDSDGRTARPPRRTSYQRKRATG